MVKCLPGQKRWKRSGWSHLNKYTRSKGTICERCGFVAEDLCQLEVNHKNGDHSDDRPENLQTLCVNCHRLITKLSGHHRWRAERGLSSISRPAWSGSDD